MKKIFAIAAICVTAIALLPNIIDALIVFLLAGQLPATHLSISPTVIYIASVLVGCGLVAHLIITAVEHFSARKKGTTQSPRKVALPAKRYHRLHS